MSEPFDKCWRRVGLALDQAGIVVNDKDRAKRMYFVSVSKQTEQKQSLLERLKFWSKDEASKPEPYQVFVREYSGVCRVGANNKNEAKDETTSRIAELLYQQLKK